MSLVHRTMPTGSFRDALTLAAWPFRIFILYRGDRSHAAMLWLAAQPTEKGALEKFSVKPICLCPPVLTRDRYIGRVDDIGVDLTSAQPARQPEAVAPSLIGDGDRLTLRPACIASLRQRRRSCSNTSGSEVRSIPGTIPATSRPAHLDDRNQCCVLLAGN